MLPAVADDRAGLWKQPYLHRTCGYRQMHGQTVSETSSAVSWAGSPWCFAAGGRCSLLGCRAVAVGGFVQPKKASHSSQYKNTQEETPLQKHATRAETSRGLARPQRVADTEAQHFLE